MKNISVLKFAFLFVIFANGVVDISHKVLLQNIAFKVFSGSEQVIWISIINAMIILPFLFLFSFGGYLSDKYDKKKILIYGALSSFVLSVVMVLAYLSGNFYFAMVTLTLLAVQSAIYSPAKFGLIIDIYGKNNLSKGNSYVQAVSVLSILLALGATSFVFESFYTTNSLSSLHSKEELFSAILPLTYYVLPIAFLEMFISFTVLGKINTTPTNQDLNLNKTDLLTGKLLVKNIKTITSSTVLTLCIVGLSVFWGVSQGLMAVFPSFVKEYLGINDVFVINGIIASSGLGIVIGSMWYARLSKHYIEVGTIPFATIGMAVSIFLCTVVESPLLLACGFLMFGIFGGMFIVPLNALIQFNSPKKRLGTILAGNNWLHSFAMFLILAMTTVVSFYELNPLNTLYIILSLAILGSLYTLYKLPQSFILLFVKFILGVRYKLEVDGLKNIPSNRGVLLLGNHISWIDWAIVFMSVPRTVRFVMHKPIYEKWYLTWIFDIFGVIPIANGSSKNSMQSIAKALDGGDIVALFPEGGITRNGHLGEVKKGFEKILSFTEEEVCVVPFYLRGLWESKFSRANKKFQSSHKTKNIAISFGKVLNKKEATASNIKQAIMEISTDSWRENIHNLGSLSSVILTRLKEVSKQMIFADSTGVELSGNRFLTASILFKKKIAPYVKHSQNVAILLPSTSIGAIINYSCLMLGKTIVNLNFTADPSSLEASVQSANIKTLVTSKQFLTKLKNKGVVLDDVLSLMEVVFVEDMKKDISKLQGLATLVVAKFTPTCLLKKLHLAKVGKTDTALILFSSGSEGKPKGIELSGDNILGNSKQVANILNVNDDDIIIGSLPLFHAFGIVVTTFLPLIEGIKCIAHPDPTDGLGLGKLVAQHRATIMCGTSTFFRLYTKNPKLHPLMFESLRLVISGAEKLRDDVKAEFKAKFAKEIYEGYGTTETSPVASVNLPNVLAPDFTMQVGNKKGSVGMPIPGTRIKIVDPSSFEELEVAEEGMVVISGVQVMKGYFENREKTNEVLKTIDNQTYYVTGDKGRVDKDGFLTIVDRYSRFAKLGGEMVSLGLIEEKLSSLLQNSEIDFVVVSLPDAKKGEKIALLISGITEDEISTLKQDMAANFGNNLMVPTVVQIVEEIPKLGSGKKDFVSAKGMF